MDSGTGYTAARQTVSHVSIFVATRWELQAVGVALQQLGMTTSRERMASGCRRLHAQDRRHRISLIQCGIGPTRAARASRQIVEGSASDLIISAGFACALTPSGIADLLIGSEVVRLPMPGGGSPAMPCDPGFQAKAVAAAKEAAVPARVGRIVTVDRVQVHAQQKQAVAAASGAMGLDMESAALGAVAREREIPFMIARTVSDLVDEGLPADLNLFLTRSGWVPGIVTLLRPSSIRGLWRLKRQAAAAGSSLTAFFTAFLRAL